MEFSIAVDQNKEAGPQDADPAPSLSAKQSHQWAGRARHLETRRAA